MRKIILVSFFMLTMPLFGLANSFFDYNSQQTAGFLEPDQLFKALKENITIPLGPDINVQVPTPQESLKNIQGYKPKAEEINKQVEEDTGVNLKKFLTFLAKMFINLFQTIISSLQSFIDFIK